MLLCTAGLALLGYLVAADWIAGQRAAEVISTMTDEYDPLDDPELSALRRNAERYNALKGGEPDPGPLPAPETPPADGSASDGASGDASGDGAAASGDASGADASTAAGGSASDDVLPYEDQLLFRGLFEMAWVSVPKIDVAQPVYHGTSDAVLAVGIGHLSESSLPVGGASSHCVLTGHSGMAGNRMFDDIRRLEVGDVFVVHTLGLPYAYRVYGTDTVWPDERGTLAIQPGRDLCTLVTCTPLGVNDHRLLVHGERVDYDPSMEPEDLPFVPAANSRTFPLLIGIAAVVIAAIVLLARRLRDRAPHALSRNDSDSKGA